MASRCGIPLPMLMLGWRLFIVIGVMIQLPTPSTGHNSSHDTHPDLPLQLSPPPRIRFQWLCLHSYKWVSCSHVVRFHQHASQPHEGSRSIATFTQIVRGIRPEAKRTYKLRDHISCSRTINVYCETVISGLFNHFETVCLFLNCLSGRMINNDRQVHVGKQCWKTTMLVAMLSTF